MKVAGFSFVRNAKKFGYPVVQSIKSVLPICDIFVIAVGKSDDNTHDLIKSIKSEKIKIIETIWDKNLRQGGEVLAVETDKAFAAISDEFDWAFYIQADEVIHEQYHAAILRAMEIHKNDTKIDGLLFNYMHFFGSYDYVGISSNYYPHEIRIIKNNKNFYSYKDAQGFRKYDNQKLNVKSVDAYVYHYGWVRAPQKMTEKIKNFHRLYHTDEIKTVFSYEKSPCTLQKFNGTHPEVMQNLISDKNWTFDCDISFSRVSLKDKLKKLLKQIGINTYYKNYKII